MSGSSSSSAPSTSRFRSPPDSWSRTVPGEVWLREPRAYRATPPLTRDRIVTATVELLDADGTDGLTMRRLAEHLGAGSTTLYWHVRTKDDVLDLALPSPAGDWRADVRALITGWRAAMLRHPWAPAPNVLARTEFLQATLARDGFAGAALTQAAAGRPGVSADDHVRAHDGAYPTLAATGHLGEQDWDDLFARALDSFLAGLEGTR